MYLLGVGNRQRLREKGYLGRVVPNFPKQGEEFRRERDETG